MNKCIDDTCFMCKFFTHLDPDTDYCGYHSLEVFFDTSKCNQFQPIEQGILNL